MRYLVDGYNLMFRLSSLIGSFQERRRMTIADLNTKITALHLDVAIIFDAQHTPEEYTKGHFGSLEIYFTGYQETADAWILDLVRESSTKQKITVVTSDRPLATDARYLGAQAISIEAFLTWINKRYSNTFRHKKEKPLSQIALTAPAEPSKKKTKPAPKASPDECLDYYHEIFSKKILEENPLPSALPSLKEMVNNHGIKKGQKVEEDLMEYYRKLFESKLHDFEQ